MKKIKMTKENMIIIKDIVIFVYLFLWMIMPILQTINIFNEFIIEKNLYFILMKVIATVGIGVSIIIIYNKFKKSDNKKETLKEIFPIILFIIYMIWTLNSCYHAPVIKRAFEGDSYRKEGYLMYINYAGFFLCSMLLENKKLRKALLNTFIISSIFLIIVDRICLGGEKFLNIFTNNTIENAVFYQFNHYGYYLMMSLICTLGLFITEKNKYLKTVYLIAYTLIGYASIYNDTFGCYLAIIVILILYAIYAIIKKKDRKAIFIAIIVFALLSGITFKDNINLAYRNISQLNEDIKTIICKIMNIELEDIDEKLKKAGTNRMELWINGIKFVLERPIIGYGPDNLAEKYEEQGIDQDRPHNLLIYLACVSGIPGMIIYITAVGIIVVNGIKKILNNKYSGLIYLLVVITYLISSMFGNSMYYTSPYFFIFLGSLMNDNLKNKNNL